MNHTYSHLIWDFNGTLLNDVDACIQSANALLSAHGLPTLKSHDQYRSVFGFPVVDYYQRLGFDFSRVPFSVLAVEWVEHYHRFSRSAALYEGVPLVLAQVYKARIPQYVLSATEASMLHRQVSALGISQYFEELLGMDDIHAHGKTERGLAWRHDHPDAKPLLIGDTDHDAAVAKAMGIDFALFAGGHQSKKQLLACEPIRVLDNLVEVLELLQI